MCFIAQKNAVQPAVKINRNSIAENMKNFSRIDIDLLNDALIDDLINALIDFLIAAIATSLTALGAQYGGAGLIAVINPKNHNIIYGGRILQDCSDFF
jgi:hypothetical protein